MSRMKVENCIENIDNRFELVLLAGYRARQISKGAIVDINSKNDKNLIVALNEIANEKISLYKLKEELIRSLQKNTEVDKIETQLIALDKKDNQDNNITKCHNEKENKIIFEEFVEEDLLHSIKNLVTPDKREDS